ncbi:alpha/beta hydrolase [Leptospira barantonii]|uniref:Alpha/beta hydrolase n=1 Tax=Leptospira barantonii TaxID=2023184 RepID=A0A5F2BDY7_9LEPT|nr:alpha/beta hydrolase [Leptospira barantonii]TGM03784.1 alpha/beta hydrolase [Leptospira barantonii]
MKRKLIWLIPVLPILVLPILCAGLWSASNQLLFPSWHGVVKDLSVCKQEAETHWGKGCGNLRATKEFEFEEIKILSINGYELPGWRIETQKNGFPRSQGAILLVHGGGSDRREMTRHIRFFLKNKLDVLTFDLGCHGDAPCSVEGLTYGHRESRDVFSAYLYLLKKYKKVYAMGSSIGAGSILIALPQMPKLKAVIAENPMESFQRLIFDSPEAQSAPKKFVQAMIDLSMLRGRFDGLLSPKNSLRLENGVPIYFIHSQKDRVVSYRQTQELFDLYDGPKTIWLPDFGDHGTIRDINPEEYEQKLSHFLMRTE